MSKWNPVGGDSSGASQLAAPSSQQEGSSSSICRDFVTANEQAEGRGSKQQRRFSACCSKFPAGGPQLLDPG